MAAIGQRNRRFFIFRRMVVAKINRGYLRHFERGNNVDNFGRKYFSETSLRIQYEGFTVYEEKDGLLPVQWAGHRVCNVNGNGGIIYDPEQIRKTGLEDALDRVREVVGDTLAHMRHMETVPPLLADGLSGDYRLLAKYSGTVLGTSDKIWGTIRHMGPVAGRDAVAGTLFQSRRRVRRSQAGLYHPLLPAVLLFTREQLAVIFDAAQNMAALDLVSNPEQGKLLEGIVRQIEEVVPQVIDLANELTQTPRQQEPEEMQL